MSYTWRGTRWDYYRTHWSTGPAPHVRGRTHLSLSLLSFPFLLSNFMSPTWLLSWVYQRVAGGLGVRECRLVRLNRRLWRQQINRWKRNERESSESLCHSSSYVSRLPVLLLMLHLLLVVRMSVHPSVPVSLESCHRYLLLGIFLPSGHPIDPFSNILDSFFSLFVYFIILSLFWCSSLRSCIVLCYIFPFFNWPLIHSSAPNILGWYQQSSPW